MSKRLLAGLFLLLAPVGCELGTREVGSRFLQSWSLQGNTEQVLELKEGALAGAALRVPAGALPEGGTITLEEAGRDLVLPGDSIAGWAAAWGPEDITLRQPVRVTLPFTLQEGRSAERLIVVVEEQGGARRTISHDKLVVDAAQGRVSFDLPALAIVQACTDDNGDTLGDGGTRGEGESCGVDADCLSGLHCSSKVCKVEDSPHTDGGVQQGEACSKDGDCIDGLTCHDGLCEVHG